MKNQEFHHYMRNQVKEIAGYREKLAGSDTEQVYLTSGTYHRLADMIRVGWHPRFRELMSKLVKAS
mgnify:CR=1 FL=1